MTLTRILICTVLAAGIALAQSGSQGKAAKAQDKPKPAAAAPAAPMTPPANAEKVDENTYRAKEADGKVWTYRKTPFGWSRTVEGAEQTASAPIPGNEFLKVIGVDGDNVRLERATPFGPSRWTKKKADLSADESEALARFTDSRRTTASSSVAKQ